MIIEESFSVDATDPGFIVVHHTEIHARGIDMSGRVWFERCNLDWVVATLNASLTIYAYPEATLDRGDDRLKIYESGHEQAPCTNLYNRRPPGAVRGGLSGTGMSRNIALQVLHALAALRNR